MAIDNHSEQTLEEPTVVSSMIVAQVLDQAFLSYRSNQVAEAEELCRQVLAHTPEQPDALQLLAGILSRKGQYDQAARLLSRAVQYAPGHAQLHSGLGAALKQAGKANESIPQFEKAIEIRPDFAEAYNNLAAALLELETSEKAIAACQKAISLKPTYKEAYNNLGLAHKQNGDLPSAIDAYRQALSIDDTYTNALSNLGMALMAQARWSEAETALTKAVTLRPDSPELRNNLGVLYNRQGLFDKAALHHQKAIDIQPDYLEARNNLGTALMERSCFDEAQTEFETALRMDPECAPAHHNLSLVLLLKGQFERGWPEYEWRWKNPGFSTPRRPFKHPWWDGSTQGIGKLLIWCEQGAGDEAQWAGLIPLVHSLGIDTLLECDPRLVPLFKRSFPYITVVSRTDSPENLLNDSSITHQIPIASIPNILKLEPDKIASTQPYLQPDPLKRDRFRALYKAQGNPLLIGISFKSRNTQQGPQRSVGLDQWGPILKTPNTRFINLQYGDCTASLNQARDLFGVNIIHDTNVNPLTDLDSFSAQIAAMDLVISVDNSTVHFAGALGIEVWTMLPLVPDWRWRLTGNTTPWYPHMRLFRQTTSGRWQTVISQVADRLDKLASAK